MGIRKASTLKNCGPAKQRLECECIFNTLRHLPHKKLFHILILFNLRNFPHVFITEILSPC
jgi:hypothetical protein